MKLVRRTGSSSARWGWMRRMILRRADGLAYLDRIRLIQTPWFGVYLHRFDAPDPGKDLHDHPWPFVTMVLVGGYTELRADAREAVLFAGMAEAFPTTKRGHERHLGRFRPRRMRLTECHTITALDRPGTRTLVLVGRRQRDWGFYTPSGYVGHNHYDFAVRRELVLQEDGRIVRNTNVGVGVHPQYRRIVRNTWPRPINDKDNQL